MRTLPPRAAALAAASLIVVGGSAAAIAQDPAARQLTPLSVKRHLPADAASTTALAAADFDGDGDVDLLLGNNGPDRLLLNDGSGSFVDGTSGRVPSLPNGAMSDLVLADLDGDGDLDASGAAFAGVSQLLLNRGDGSFVDRNQSLPRHAVAVLPRLVSGDLDEDGDVDLVFVGAGGAEPLRLFLNDGAAAFTDATTTRATGAEGGSTALEFGDVDGDGDLDLVAAGVGVPRLYRNLHRQVSAPRVPVPGRRFEVQLHVLPGYAAGAHVAVPVLAASLLARPVRLPPVGTLFVDPATAVALPALTIPAPGGAVTTAFRVPAVPALSGQVFHVQAVIAEAGPGDVRFTGVLNERVFR